jgi:hypothetical protein
MTASGQCDKQVFFETVMFHLLQYGTFETPSAQNPRFLIDAVNFLTCCRQDRYDAGKDCGTNEAKGSPVYEHKWD